MLPQSTAHIVFKDVELPPRAMFGIRESYEVIGEVETDRDIHGKLILLQPSWMSLTGDEIYRITLSSSGDGVDTLLLDDLTVGTEMEFHSTQWWVATIKPGETSVRLKRKPVPGSVTGRNPRLIKSPPIAITMDDDDAVLATIPAILGYPVNVHYRPIHEVTVTKRDRGDNERHGRSRSSSLTLEETEMPSFPPPEDDE